MLKFVAFSLRLQALELIISKASQLLFSLTFVKLNKARVSLFEPFLDGV